MKQGCIAYKIAAHAADVALGIPGRARPRRRAHQGPRRAQLGEALRAAPSTRTRRARYHDEDLDVDTDFCAMCGHDWCSVRISKEIDEFVSGKDAALRLGRGPRSSAALTPEQREILEQRGVLEPGEVHRLASKTRRAMDAATAQGGLPQRPGGGAAPGGCGSEALAPLTRAPRSSARA